ncbi:hypothetical protein BGX27_003184 [Mortierella sp. AM989]|nr:hypothetical protein BGX27_003184 [Mortierella sp. AM989]
MPTDWAEDIEGDELLPQTFTDSNGITTYIEFRVDEDGKKVKMATEHQTFH